MNHYQAAVIGGGPGGYIAAIQCAQRGLKTVLVEKDALGGTCLNRGCIPTKTLLHSSDVYHEILNCKSLGIEVKGDVEYKYKKIAKRKDKVVKQLRSGVEALVAGHGADIVKGTAVMTGAKTFQVGEEVYEADNIILATGSEPAYIPIPGADREGVINSDGVMNLQELPDRITIIGGGVIGVEFATLFANLGKQVTILEMMPSILYGNEPQICDLLTFILTEEKGVAVHTGAKVCEIKEDLGVVYEQNGETLTSESDLVILSIGRKPVTDDLNLVAAGVSVTERGFVEVDDHMRTNVPGIYAIGDITGKIQLAHVATAQGMAAADNAAGLNHIMEYNAVPSCIYTTPEIACVGLTEEQAKAAGYETACGTFDISGNGRSLAINSTNGLVKLVTDAKTDKILGCHIITANATEMIGEVTAAIKCGLTSAQIADTIHAHPTVSESIMEAAHDVHGMCCHKL